MEIRVATKEDVPILVELGALFIEESPVYQSRGYVHELAADHFTNLIMNSGVILVVEHNGVICGGFAGAIGKDWFNGKRIAYDHVLYVKPEYRKSRAAYMLIDAFINWARLMNADFIQCGTTTGVESQACIRLYKHFGFHEFGTVLEMKV